MTFPRNKRQGNTSPKKCAVFSTQSRFPEKNKKLPENKGVRNNNNNKKPRPLDLRKKAEATGFFEKCGLTFFYC